MINRFFDHQNPIMQVLTAIFDLAILNILWLLFSLPVLTMGNATAAAAAVCFRMIQDKSSGVVRPFWKSFKSNFKPATGLWLLMLAVIALLGFDLWYFLLVQNFLSGVLLSVICGVLLLLLLATLVITTYAICLTALFENTVRITLCNAALLSLRNLPRNLAVLTVYAAMARLAIYVPLTIPPVTVAVIFLGFSFTIFLNCRILFPIFRPYLQKGAQSPSDTQ